MSDDHQRRVAKILDPSSEPYGIIETKPTPIVVTDPEARALKTIKEQIDIIDVEFPKNTDEGREKCTDASNVIRQTIDEANFQDGWLQAVRIQIPENEPINEERIASIKETFKMANDACQKRILHEERQKYST